MLGARVMYLSGDVFLVLVIESVDLLRPAPLAKVKGGACRKYFVHLPALPNKRCRRLRDAPGPPSPHQTQYSLSLTLSLDRSNCINTKLSWSLPLSLSLDSLRLPLPSPAYPSAGTFFYDSIIDGMVQHQNSAKLDASGAALGRRYARMDELGAPFGVTVDFQTVEDKSVTLRERDSMTQIRMPLADVAPLVARLVTEEATWQVRISVAEAEAEAEAEAQYSWFVRRFTRNL